MERRRLAYIALALLTILAGYVCRFAHLGLPPCIVKYGGSALWAAMIYWLLAAAFPLSPARTLAIATTIIATAIEFAKLVHTPALEYFRGTFAGRVMLGRIFSPRDFVAYYIAIAMALWLDIALRSRLQSTGID